MKIKRASIIFAVLVVVLLLATPLSAAEGDVDITDVRNAKVCPEGTAYVDITFNELAGDYFELYMYNKTENEWHLLADLPPLSTTYWGPWDVGNINEGDTLEFWVYYYNGAILLDEDLYRVSCGQAQAKEASREHQEPYTGIYLLSEAEQAPYFAVPTAEGDLPCGVFNVNGWGAKYVGMGDFPGCTAPVTVMCLNGDREWTAANVSDVVMQGDWEVDFTSSQDGVCALFD